MVSPARPLIAALLFALAPHSAALAQRSVPTPASVIGFEPGADRKLPSWKQVADWFTQLAASTPRVQLHTLGRTTLGRPFLAAIIADSATIAQLPRYREIQGRLADPRMQRPGERPMLLDSSKVVILVTSSIHSTEVGGILTPLELAHRLASSEDAEAKAIRANSIVILVPSLNPDGVDIVGDWYRSTLGTAWEGSGPPELYHHYTGHDNNRDWYAFTQVETQMVIDSLYSQWHPSIVNDIHQQGSNGSRIFIPPYMDPIEPNIDPILMSGVAEMGKAMTWRLTSLGFTGIANNTSYDAWTPARAYQHYHGAIRILTETASGALASPITVAFDSLRAGYNVDPRVATTDFLAPWAGGRWTLGDIVRYQTAATWALLEHAARNRGDWQESFANVGDKAVGRRPAPERRGWPAAILIPPQPARDTAVRAVLRILQRGQVEVRRATSSFTSSGKSYATGTYIISLSQPYGSFAKALLEPQRYPDLREYPGGPPKRPYDVTAHTLPLLYGVEVEMSADSVAAPSEALPAVRSAPLIAAGLTGSRRRIALFRNYAPSMDEGWTRWVLDQYRIPFSLITAKDIRSGNLASRFDAIILPDQSARAIARGPVGPYPDSLKGGIGEEGAAKLEEFVTGGGTLVAFNNASLYAIQALKLPVRNALEGIAAKDFYAPGSIFRVQLNASSPLSKGFSAPQPAVWFEESPAFEITDATRATLVASYPTAGDPLLSGWLLGAPKLAGKGALVDVREGKGRVILFGFRPQYRGQTMSTLPLLWNVLRER